MTVRDWIAESAARVERQGWQGVTESLYELYLGGLRRTNRLYPYGTNVFEREWDVLVLLDGCRDDLLSEVAGHHPFLSQPATITSVGNSSIDWLEQTFVPAHADQFQGTAYVTGNPFSHRTLDGGDLGVLDEVWRYAWDDERGTIPARPLTDRAISVAREHDPERLIVHYMQPHFPSVPEPLTDGMNTETLGEGAGWESPWKLLRRGELEYEVVWKAYRSNLEYVLEEVALLFENVNAETAVVSADHGNAAGEWGVYGHPKIPLPAIREVPWYETMATDERTYEPELERGYEPAAAEDKHKTLGYL